VPQKKLTRGPEQYVSLIVAGAAFSNTPGRFLGLTHRYFLGCRSQIRNNFFGMRIVNLWNSLSDTVATAPSVNCFKGRFDRQNAGNRFSMEWVNGEDRGETIKSFL